MGRHEGYRKYSKSTLVRATKTLLEERRDVVQAERRKWLRRLAAAAGGAFLVGAGLGAVVSRLAL